MSIDPMTGVEIPHTQPRRPLRESDNPLNREISDELGAQRDLEERTSSFWLPFGIAVAVPIGVAYYFFSPPSNADVNSRAASAVTHTEPSPH